MTNDLSGRIAAFLDANHVMSLASIGPDGPHAANLFYARDGLGLIWVSDKETRHSREVAANPRVAATVAPDCQDFMDVQGVQIAGQAHCIDEAGERQRLLSFLEERYPFLKRLSQGPDELREAYARSGVYLLKPKRIVLIDNSRGFGHKDELVLEG